MKRLLAALALALASSLSAGATPPPQASVSLGADVREAVAWITRTLDNQSMPYAIVDKKAARVFVFGADGVLQGQSPVLLGAARGDHSVPGIGDREMSSIRPEERTTPAGRFVSEPGINTQGEDIVWVDYDAAVSMHRVRANVASQRRLERLATPTPSDNRISYGCINVPRAFYEAHVLPLFGAARAVVYVLPETRPVATLFVASPHR